MNQMKIKHHKYRARPGWYSADLQPCAKDDGVYYFKSALEVQFARRLELEKRAGDIIDWSYEPVKITLRRKDGERYCDYRPDFKIYVDKYKIRPGDDYTDLAYFLECKGMLRPGDRRKLALAASQLSDPLYVFTARWGKLPAEEYLNRMKKKGIKLK